eukprot:11228355-Lingulodinium_polyedra.AAC.5
MMSGWAGIVRGTRCNGGQRRAAKDSEEQPGTVRNSGQRGTARDSEGQRGRVGAQRRAAAVAGAETRHGAAIHRLIWHVRARTHARTKRNDVPVEKDPQSPTPDH